MVDLVIWSAAFGSAVVSLAALWLRRESARGARRTALCLEEGLTEEELRGSLRQDYFNAESLTQPADHELPSWRGYPASALAGDDDVPGDVPRGEPTAV